MSEPNNRLGILLMIATTLVLSMQDGLSRHLAETYNTLMVVMVRYWFFAAFVLVIASRQGGIRTVARTEQPGLQIFRGVLLALEICVTVLAFTYLGLIETMAILISYPLMIAALSGPVLGETVGWRRWLAIGVGFVGVLIILQPGVRVFSAAALIPLFAAFMFALYGLLTRFAARKDRTATSFFWTGIAGAITMTLIGVASWEPMTRPDWIMMGALCVSGAFAHWLLIRCYEVAEASAVQPFAYLHLVFISVIGITVFGEVLRGNVILGASLVVGAGVFTLWRQHRQAQADKRASGEAPAKA